MQYATSPLGFITSPCLDSSASSWSTSNQQKLLSPSSHSSESRQNPWILTKIPTRKNTNQYDESHDHDETRLEFVTDVSDFSPSKRQGNWDNALTRGAKEEAGPSRKVKRGEKRKMRNRLTQAAFRVRTKVHHAEVCCFDSLLVVPRPQHYRAVNKMILYCIAPTNGNLTKLTHSNRSTTKWRTLKP